MLIRIRTIALAAAALLFVVPSAWIRRAAPEAKTGLKVAQRAPKFILKDQEGRDRSLDEFLGKRQVALVFYRSAGW